MTYNSILIERDAPVATITMNRPEKRNALSSEMMRELVDALRDTQRRTRGARHRAGGQRPAFSAGHDLRELVDGDINRYRAVFDLCTELMNTVQAIPQPVIARVHRIATAAGCQLVATCDLAVAAEEATFGTPGVKIGLFCTTPMVALSRAIGRKRALQMLMTGKLISAETAADWGLVNTVVPADQLESAARDLALSMPAPAAHRGPGQAGILHPDRPRPAQGLRLCQRSDEHERDGRRCAGGHAPSSTSASLPGWGGE